MNVVRRAESNRVALKDNALNSHLLAVSNEVGKIPPQRGLSPREVDGGVTRSNASSLVNAGADILVAASAIYGDSDPANATRGLRAAALNSDNQQKVDQK